MILNRRNIIEYLNMCLVVVLIIFLPFVFDDDLMDSTQSAKYLFFIVSILVILFLWFLCQLFKQKRPAFQITLVDIILTLFVIYVSIRVFSLIEQYGISHRYIELVGLGCLYIVIRTIDSRYYGIFLLALIFSGTGQAIYGNLQLFGIYKSHHSLFNITGGFFNPGPYAGYLAVILPIGLTTYLSNNSHFNKNLTFAKEWHFFSKVKIGKSLIFRGSSLISIISILLVLPASGSRAAWMAAIVCSMFLLAAKFKFNSIIQSKFYTTFNKTLAAFSILLIVFIMLIGLYTMKKGSADGRILIWIVTSNMISQQPIFGFGYDRFQANYLHYQARYFERLTTIDEVINADNTTRAFNEYLQITSELGIIGLGLVLVTIVLLFMDMLRSSSVNIILLAARMSLLSCMVFGMFSYPLEILPIKVCITINVALIAYHQKALNLNNIGFLMDNGIYPFLKTIGIVTVVVFGFSIGNHIINYYRSVKQWKRGFVTYQIGAYKASVKEYEKIYMKLKYNGEYLVNYGKACSMAGDHIKAVQVLSEAEMFLPNSIVYTSLGDSYKAIGQLDNAELAYMKASQMIPSRIYPKYLLVKLYDEIGQHLKALNLATHIMGMNIKVESKAVQAIKKEMEKIIEKNKFGQVEKKIQ